MKGDFLLIKDISEKELMNNSGYIFLKNKYKYYRQFKYGNYYIALFSNTDDFFITKTLFFGTILYQGKYNNEAFNIIVNKNYEVNWEEVNGNYLILDFNNSDNFNIILDPLRKYHVFFNDKEQILSSSFLATCYASKALYVDKLGFYERLMRGYNIAPDTLFSNIKQLYDQKKISFNLFDNRYINKNQFIKVNNRQEMLMIQKETLIKLLSNYKNIIEQKGGDLGLSGGYDSRLLLSLFNKLDFNNIQIHSHSIKNVNKHSSERKIAKILAEKTKYPFKVIEVLPFDKLEKNELEKSILDNWIYYDGRNSHNMGSLAPNYTSFYKRKIMGKKNVSINGIGGEIFRNYYVFNNNSNTYYFVANHLFYRFSNFFINKIIYKDVYNNVINKINLRLDISIQKKISLREVRRYYNEIRMPDGDGNNHNAHNKFYDFLTPFIEPILINSTNGIEKYLGMSGKFEGDLIEMIDSVLASIPSNYGNTITDISLSNKLKNLYKFYAPQQLQRYRFDNWYKKSRFDSIKNFKSKIMNKSDFVKNYWDHIENLYPNINWEAINTDFASLANANMMALTLYMLKEKINNYE